MKLMLLTAALLMASPAQANWFEDIRRNREKRAAEELLMKEVQRKQNIKMIKQRWRQKQYSKIFDGLKGFLSKGRFKYLIMGTLGGSILTASAIWHWCHDGCRLFNPKDDETPPPTTISIHQHQAPNPSLPPEPERPSPELPLPELPELDP